MNQNRYNLWVAALGIIATAGIIVGTVLLLSTPNVSAASSPWNALPERAAHVDHTDLIEGPIATGQEATRACLACHEESAEHVMQTTHWTWQAPAVDVAWSDEPVSIGKANALNNFCLGVESNISGCSRCHSGYGWVDETFDFTVEENVDCLVCHDQTGSYVKANGGLPAEGVDLLTVAQNVGYPTRETCGGCHFNGGGGNGVKHADLSESMYFPPENVDVHMGRHDFVCTDCHQTTDHQISGRALSVSVDDANQIACTDCHDSATTHNDERINTHLDSVACQTCHIPAGALRDPTKVNWDWSTAGDATREEDPHEYLQIKGSFVYESDLIPDYYWYNGVVSSRYLFGDLLDPDGVTELNPPAGDINDPTAMIFPFKVHTARQPYDTVYDILLLPNTVGPTGYWTTFDWDSALAQGAEAAGIPFSGSYDFTETTMYWPITHMVQPTENALQCTACHGETNTRMDWEALGYPGDPMTWGGR